MRMVVEMRLARPIVIVVPVEVVPDMRDAVLRLFHGIADACPCRVGGVQ